MLPDTARARRAMAMKSELSRGTRRHSLIAWLKAIYKNEFGPDVALNPVCLIRPKGLDRTSGT